MKYRTELMEQILTNPKAQEIIDFVSQIYGESYVGLWIFQVIGEALEPTERIAAELRYETSPTTATLLLPYWEEEYGLEPDPTMTVVQRRRRIMARMQSKGACNPKRLEQAISGALGGAVVEVMERTGKNKFTVNIRTIVKSYLPAIAVIESMKPAHLIYEIQGVTEEGIRAQIKLGSALTITEFFEIRANNATSIVLTPILEGNNLKIRRRNPITQQETIVDPTHTDDGQGNIGLPTIQCTYEAVGNVTLIPTIIVNPEEE